MESGINGASSGRRDWPATIAHYVINHRRSLLLLTAALAVISVLVLVWRARFASDVLDLLPRHFDSVQVFKQFDREFSQARELTFGILDETGTVDLDAFVDHFADELRAEPWIARVMEKSPMESSDGIRDAQRLATPLLLNLPPEDFARALKALEPATIDARITHLRAALESGSPKADFDLDFDPLGIVGPAFKPLAGSFSMEQTRPLASPDGTLRVVLALTRQDDLGAHACQVTMQNVERFRQHVLASWDGPKPQILATGRTAYVGELSLKMRSDVLSTIGSSVILVAGMFWIGFRRFRPLVAILHTLLLCCLLAVAFGALVFGELNMITIGLCSILVGLGVDFGMIVFGIFQVELGEGRTHEEAVASALRQQGKAIAFGASTTAAAFLCLVGSECSGFMQLGVLIAFGILAAGTLMLTVFFLMLGKLPPKPMTGWRFTGARSVEHIFAHPRCRALIGLGVFGLVALLGYGPFGAVLFEANPKTLEPRNSQAGEALRTIQKKMPIAGEPVLAVVSAPDAEAFHTAWQVAQQRWSALVREGKLKSVNSPAAFAISPQRVAANQAAAAKMDLEASRRALEAAWQREGLTPASLSAAVGIIEGLKSVASADVRQLLPAESPWWFIIDRFLPRNGGTLGAAYLTPAQPVKDFAAKEALRRAIELPGTNVRFSGWSYMLADLVPWAKTKLFQLTVSMVLFNVLLLSFLFRRVPPMAILFTGLALSIGAMLAILKIAGIPLNLFNVLAFPLVLGVGVDYGIYLVVAVRAPGAQKEVSAIFKPVLLSGLTTIAGFASLGTAENPALRSLGSVCALGVGCCLMATFFFVLPFAVWRERR